MFTATIIIIMCAIVSVAMLFIVIRAENRLKKTTAILNAYYEKYGNSDANYLINNYSQISRILDQYMGYHSIQEQVDYIKKSIYKTTGVKEYTDNVYKLNLNKN